MELKASVLRVQEDLNGSSVSAGRHMASGCASKEMKAVGRPQVDWRGK